MKKVVAIEMINGEKVFNIASSEATSDWIRAGRLIKKGKRKQMNILDEKPMYYRPDSMIENLRNPKKGS